jgi:hypothetical protein
MFISFFSLETRFLPPLPIAHLFHMDQPICSSVPTILICGLPNSKWKNKYALYIYISYFFYFYFLLFFNKYILHITYYFFFSFILKMWNQYKYLGITAEELDTLKKGNYPIMQHYITANLIYIYQHLIFMTWITMATSQ